MAPKINIPPRHTHERARMSLMTDITCPPWLNQIDIKPVSAGHTWRYTKWMSVMSKFNKPD